MSAEVVTTHRRPACSQCRYLKGPHCTHPEVNDVETNFYSGRAVMADPPRYADVRRNSNQCGRDGKLFVQRPFVGSPKFFLLTAMSVLGAVVYSSVFVTKWAAFGLLGVVVLILLASLTAGEEKE